MNALSPGGSSALTALVERLQVPAGPSVAQAKHAVQRWDRRTGIALFAAAFSVPVVSLTASKLGVPGGWAYSLGVLAMAICGVAFIRFMSMYSKATAQVESLLQQHRLSQLKFLVENYDLAVLVRLQQSPEITPTQRDQLRLALNKFAPGWSLREEVETNSALPPEKFVFLPL